MKLFTERLGSRKNNMNFAVYFSEFTNKPEIFSQFHLPRHQSRKILRLANKLYKNKVREFLLKDCPTFEQVNYAWCCLIRTRFLLDIRSALTLEITDTHT